MHRLHLWNQEQREHDVDRVGNHRKCYHVRVLLETVLLCEHLKSDANLPSVILSVCRLVLPPQAAEHIQALINNTNEQRRLHTPSAATVSRARARVEAAYMFVCRNTLFARPDCLRICIMVDSSPQGGRDYELLMMTIVAKVKR